MLKISLFKKTLSPSEKVQLLDYRKKNPKIGYRDIAEIFKIKKKSAATFIKNEEKFRKKYASFQGNRKRNRRGKFQKLSEAMYRRTQNVVQAICIPQVLSCKKKHCR